MRRQLADHDKIKKWALSQRQPFSSSELVDQFKVSRQTAARILKEMVDAGNLQKTGSTRSALYSKATGTKKRERAPSHLLLIKKISGLAEDRVFDEVDLKLNLKSALSENGHAIAYYAFCEMLNNAIDHSGSKSVTIEVGVESNRFSFKIRDLGVGIFKKIETVFELDSEEQALEHLLKGKQTTAPEAHSGQGIFFTSKIADRFELRSHRLTLVFDNQKKDVVVGEDRPWKGTEVSFTISTQPKKTLPKLFKEYANDDVEFDRTTYPVLVLQQTGAISRSQARRLTSGLEKFDRIILDFAKVKTLGQGFADEIFRVYQSRHPRVVIEVRNASSAVSMMIRRAIV